MNSMQQTNSTLEQLPLLMRSEEVAEALGLSRAQAYRWIQTRRVPVLRVPGCRSVRVPREALKRWIEDRTEQPEQR
jgi:excisionase family DNA binding protein